MLKQELEALENPSMKSIVFSSAFGNAKSSGDKRSLDREIIKIEAARKRYARQLEKTVDILSALWDVIDALPDYDLKTVMLLRYLYGKTWESVRKVIGCDSRRKIYDMHNLALEEIEKRFDSDFFNGRGGTPSHGQGDTRAAQR